MESNIVKELGIFHNGESIGLSLLPPHDYKQLTERERQQNMWLTRNYHYITWNEGKHSYESLPKLLDIHGPFDADAISRLVVYDGEECSEGPVNEYFSKGLTKCKVFEDIFKVPFTNLEEFGCPNYRQLAKKDEKCSNFPFRHQHTVHCAEKKARAYGLWTEKYFNSL